MPEREKKPPLTVVTAQALLDMELPEQELILDPWLKSQGLTMIHAWRGVGKTYVGLGCACAIATGGSFLGWTAEVPKRCVYVDGELPAITMQERLIYTLGAMNGSKMPDPGYFRIITPDLQERAMPNLSDPFAQKELSNALKEVDVVFLDNISTLFRGGRENEAEGWLPAQEYALLLRRSGISVVFIHHSGKAGSQRGTSRREDILDTVIGLRRPNNYNASEGARFEVHYEKARGLYGEQVEPFEAKLEVRDNIAIWTTMELRESGMRAVMDLYAQGMEQTDIAKKLKISTATVSRRLKDARHRGLLELDDADLVTENDDLLSDKEIPEGF
ncbi:MAG: AAA family ATPase [Geminicoccaceae bacterium]